MKVLFFDLLGVIFPDKFGGSRMNIKTFYDSLLYKPISFETFYKRYHDYALGKISNADFWEGFQTDIKVIEKEYLDTYNIYENIDSLVNSLRDDYRICALSNHPADWVNYLDVKFGLKNYFEKIYVSGDIGFRKPHKELFEYAATDLAANMQDCVLIDDQNKNLVGAKESGWKTVHLKIFDDPTKFTPDAEIESFDELSDALETVF